MKWEERAAKAGMTPIQIEVYRHLVELGEHVKEHPYCRHEIVTEGRLKDLCSCGSTEAVQLLGWAILAYEEMVEKRQGIAEF
jgi:hypothetical protein